MYIFFSWSHFIIFSLLSALTPHFPCILYNTRSSVNSRSTSDRKTRRRKDVATGNAAPSNVQLYNYIVTKIYIGT